MSTALGPGMNPGGEMSVRTPAGSMRTTRFTCVSVATTWSEIGSMASPVTNDDTPQPDANATGVELPAGIRQIPFCPPP
jgi:hypothetical protein